MLQTTACIPSVYPEGSENPVLAELDSKPATTENPLNKALRDFCGVSQGLAERDGFSAKFRNIYIFKSLIKTGRPHL
jgi:hypothetical protein